MHEDLLIPFPHGSGTWPWQNLYPWGVEEEALGIFIIGILSFLLPERRGGFPQIFSREPSEVSPLKRWGHP